MFNKEYGNPLTPEQQKEQDKLLASAFKFIDDKNPDAEFLCDSALSNISSYIDTGSYTLNAIISGSLYGGIPSGRFVGYQGPSGCGKTIMLLKAIANAQKNEGRFAVVFDSENAVDRQTAINMGCDVTKFKHVPIETIEQFKLQCASLLNNAIENEQLRGKFIIVLDSLGNLEGSKEHADVLKGKSATDMGTRAKEIKAMFRALTYKAAKADCPILFSNHVYDDPANLYPSFIKETSGGKGPVYMASVLVQMSQSLHKEKGESGEELEEQLQAVVDETAPVEDVNNVGTTKKKNGKKKKASTSVINSDNVISLSKQVTAGIITGIDIDIICTKNRIIPAFLQAGMSVNFVKGMLPYGGIFDMAQAMGVITGTKSYYVGDQCIGFKKDIEGNEQIMKDIIMPALEKKLQELVKFSQV